MSYPERFNLSGSSVFVILKAQKLEIDKLKWIESEKAGMDIGFIKANCIWMEKHHKDWISGRFTPNN